MKKFAIKGNLCYSKNRNTLCITENSYVVCEDGKCSGIFETLPESLQNIPCFDYTNQLIIPGLVDLHVHAPQYSFRGLGMDLELIDWLNTHIFTEEAKYAEASYADMAYDIFAEDLIKSATTRVSVFGTLHTEATLSLMHKLDDAGMKGFVGKVNMDRNCPAYLCEESAEASAAATEQWILNCHSFKNIKPILTPRFTPTCSDELMERLSTLQKVSFTVAITFIRKSRRNRMGQKSLSGHKILCRVL